MNEVKQIGNIVNTGNWDNPQRGRIYSADGICPALNTVGGGGGLEPKIIEDFYKNREPRVYDETAPTIRAEREGLKVIEKKTIAVGGIYTDVSERFQRGILKDLSRTIKANCHDAGALEKTIVASRGRNPNNSSDRKQGIELEQMPEPNSEGICNTLTSVQKDNLVLEPKLIGGLGEKDWGKQWRQGNRVYDADAIAMALNASPVGNTGGNSYLYKTDYRIRKLTPKECWRLMGFTDEDFCKAEQVNSNTQLYKQAGNSIVVNVLEAIFKQML